MTKVVKDAHEFPVISKTKLVIKIFEDTAPKITSCKIVQSGIWCNDSMKFVIHANVVSVICTPVSKQVLSSAIAKCEHLFGLDLAGHCEGGELDVDRKVGILVVIECRYF